METVNPKKKEIPKAYLRTVVGATKRQVENKRVEEEVAAGSVEDDLREALQVSYLHYSTLALQECLTCGPATSPV